MELKSTGPAAGWPNRNRRLSSQLILPHICRPGALRAGVDQPLVRLTQAAQRWGRALRGPISPRGPRNRCVLSANLGSANLLAHQPRRPPLTDVPIIQGLGLRKRRKQGRQARQVTRPGDSLLAVGKDWAGYVGRGGDRQNLSTQCDSFSWSVQPVTERTAFFGSEQA